MKFSTELCKVPIPANLWTVVFEQKTLIRI